jgi:site-specific recombinase XerD
MVFFRWCRQEGHITSNPIESIEVPKLERKIPTKLTKQEAMRILEMVDNFPYQHPFLRFQTYAIFATFIYTGIRKKELLNLKFTDVDIENLSLFIRQGKGSKDRIIPINYKLAKALQKYLEYRKKPIKALLSFLPHILMICTLPKVASNV